VETNEYIVGSLGV